MGNMKRSVHTERERERERVEREREREKERERDLLACTSVSPASLA